MLVSGPVKTGQRRGRNCDGCARQVGGGMLWPVIVLAVLAVAGPSPHVRKP